MYQLEMDVSVRDGCVSETTRMYVSEMDVV